AAPAWCLVMSEAADVQGESRGCQPTGKEAFLPPSLRHRARPMQPSGALSSREMPLHLVGNPTLLP
ncbi:MAG TPA: hypothetical protein VGW38_25875, partial [Chloroflexota bacterium]|nr:hypothetical protein [Chloroflexota bacterium]